MNPLDLIAAIVLVLAAIPCALFLLNLMVFRRIRIAEDSTPAAPVSVLIPARNEADKIAETVRSVLASQHPNFELIILDDHSNDATAQIVRKIAERDSRVRLEEAPDLPPGWCGKQHACHVLGHLARHPTLVFIDADVRLAPDALRKMAAFLESRGAALASGVPRQELGTFSERLLIPLIHFVLLGFLPMHVMRYSKRPAFAAGCGQLFVARRDAYLAVGGHQQLRASLHDGLQLPRVFRRAGYSTELFDATPLAFCRMYQSNRDTWAGLGKNAIEGLAAPGTIGPMSFLLFGGQVAPFVLLLIDLPSLAWALSVTAAVCALIPRFIAAALYHQPLFSALLHPAGILALLAIQWAALVRHFRGKPAEWRGRTYPAISKAPTL